MKPTHLEHMKEAPTTGIGFAVFICSTSRFLAIQKGEEVKDQSFEVIAKSLQKHGHNILLDKIVPDDINEIRKAVKEATSRDDIEVIITCGGTGIAPSDVTIEAVHPLLVKELPGFGEFLRRMSYEEIGPSAMLTRALVGIIDNKVIFCLPGSPHAVKLAMESLILEVVPHLLKHLREK